MKNNTEKLKNLLSLALQSSPDDFALQEVKTHIRQAIVKLESVERKRLKREELNQALRTNNNWPVVQGVVQNPTNLRQTIDAIDEMIAEEKLKLTEIANRRKYKHEPDDEGENLQTIHG